MLRRAMWAGIALGAFLILGGASTARADDWRSCGEKIAHEQHELDRAIARHGFYSRQADHERRELDRLYAKCRYRWDRDRDYYHDYR
jgi:hypothetical protein